MRNALRKAHNATASFGRNQGGSVIILALFLIVAMAVALGMAVDVVRYETERVKTQNVIDRAVLASADLDETRDPEMVAHDWAARSGLTADRVKFTFTPEVGGKTVTAESTVDVPSFFLNMVGIETISGPAASSARETATDIEVVLVLDNSGSMNSNNRINLLKAAAKQFVTDVVRDDIGLGAVSISIVPFATQVTLPSDFASFYNLSDEHAYSSCVTFANDDFNRASITQEEPLVRTAHFNAYWTIGEPIDMRYAVCAGVPQREITLWSNSVENLHSRIDSMYAFGWTSIELGTKWGLALLDPSTRPILNDRIANNQASGDLAGMPFDYGRESTKKYLVVMSDGQNTNQWDVKDPYRSGPSLVWEDPDTGVLSLFDSESGQYYNDQDNEMQLQPAGGETAVNLTWPEAWNRMTVEYYAEYLAAPAKGGSWRDYYNEIVWRANSNTKNTRTSAVCKTARDQGVTVFSIGMDTYGQGDATLLDCASSPALFFDVAAQDIDDAFQSIARQINQLRLTQ